VDATILAQQPRLAGHRAAIRQALAEHLDLDPDRVSVKATTPDHLGAVGRVEGIAAQAVSLLEEPTSVEGASRG
jgi:2-C-methyl-D-erythritol 2,4-cyclodiphosphate synthase